SLPRLVSHFGQIESYRRTARIEMTLKLASREFLLQPFDHIEFGKQPSVAVSVVSPVGAEKNTIDVEASRQLRGRYLFEEPSLSTQNVQSVDLDRRLFPLVGIQEARVRSPSKALPWL